MLSADGGREAQPASTAVHRKKTQNRRRAAAYRVWFAVVLIGARVRAVDIYSTVPRSSSFIEAGIVWALLMLIHVITAGLCVRARPGESVGLWRWPLEGQARKHVPQCDLRQE